MALYRCPVYSQLFLISGEGFSLSNFSRPFFFSRFFLFVLPKSKFYYSHIGDTLFIIVHLRATQQQKHLLQFRVLSKVCVSPTEFRISKKEFFVFSKVKNWAQRVKKVKTATTYWMGGCSTVTILSHFSQVLRFEHQFSNTSYYY